MNPKTSQSNKTEDSVSAKDYFLLYRGIKSLIRCDEAETVRGIADYVMSQYSILKRGANFIERRNHDIFPPLAAFLGAVTRFLEVRQNVRMGDVVWVARLENERRAIEKMIPFLPDLEWSEIILRRPPERFAVKSLPRRIFSLRRRIFKLSRLLLRRNYEFFRILRVIEMIGYYAAFLEIFEREKFRLAVVSSHSNPHGIAFNLAARRCGIPVMLITHGMPVKPVAKLKFNLSVVHCEAARQTYFTEGCDLGEVYIHGRRQDCRSMPEKLPLKNLTAGIFLCKDVNENRLIEIIEKLLSDKRISRVVVRPHPKNLFVKLNEWLAALDSSRVERSFSKSVFEDLEKCDVVFGGNSSVLIEAAIGGRPACFVSRLDYASDDLHNLVSQKLIYAFRDNTRIDFEDLFSFYRRPEWFEILRFFAAVENDEKTINGQIASNIRRLIIEK